MQVEYSRELGPPVMTIADARKVGAFHTLPPIEGNKTNLPQVHFALKGLYSASRLRADIDGTGQAMHTRHRS